MENCHRKVAERKPVNEKTSMVEFVVKYWLECLFGVVTAALTWGYKRLAKRVREQEAIKEGVLAILHDRLFQAGRYHILQGYISLEELKNVEYLYRSYHALGGNGTGTEIWERIKDLPLKKKEN